MEQPAQPVQSGQPVQSHVSGVMPPNIYQQAQIQQLGMPTATYKPPLSNPLAILGMMLGVIVVDIIVLYLIILATGYLFYILIAIPIAAIIYGIYAFIDYNLRVYQFTNGIIREKGQQLDTLRWDQIDTTWITVNRRYYYSLGGALVSAFVTARGTSSIRVRRVDGATFKFTTILRNSTQLIQSIEQGVMQAHMPRAIATYQSGQPITFGTLTISRQGISNGRETLSWQEVQSVEVKRGYLQVKRVGKTFNWANVDVSKIPNLLVFVSLINGVRSGQIR